MKYLFQKVKTGENNTSAPAFYLSPNSNYASASYKLHSNSGTCLMANTQDFETCYTQQRIHGKSHIGSSSTQ